MAKIYYPRSDRDRLNVLEKSVEQSAQDRVVGQTYVVPVQMETIIQTFLIDYRPAVDLVLEMRGKRGKEVGEKTTAVSKLARYVRDFWEVLERRIEREELNRGLFIEYNQLRSGENPDGRSLQDWLNQSEYIINGEARAVADGFAPMANPSVAEIVTMRDAAIAEAADVDLAQSKLGKAQLELDALRSEADRLIRVMNAQLNITMYGMDSDTVRGIKERYGFTFYDRETAVVEEPLAETGGLDPAPEEEPPI